MAEEKELKEAKAEMNEARDEMKEAALQLREAKKEKVDVAKSRLELRREMAKEVEREITSKVVTVMTTALAVVAGLFWQTAISDTIKNFIPVSGAWQYEIMVALLVTVATAVAIYLLARSTDGIGKKGA
jgi:uncharacterized protein DUF5654